MLAIIFSWIVLFLVFIAFGDMTVLVWNKITKSKTTYSTTGKIWIGICTLGTLLLYSSIFFSISFPLLIGITASSCIYLFSRWSFFKETLCLLIKEFTKSTLTYKYLYILGGVSVLFLAVSIPLLYDMGLYHLQSMQWSESFRVIPGLGNLHGRLGFNSSFLLLSTLFNYHPSHYLLFFSINSFVILIFTWWLLRQIQQNNNSIQQLILLTTLACILFFIGKSISSTSTDILSNILILFLVISYIQDRNKMINESLFFVLIPLFCITLKLSSAPILLATLLYMIYTWKRADRRLFFLIITVGFIVIAPWIIRFIILTGYFVYPFASIDLFSFDWKIPADLVVLEQNEALAWARIPNLPYNEVLRLKFIEWFPIWFNNSPHLQLLCYMMALLSPSVILLFRRDRAFFAWAIVYIGVLFGFITAPDFRFTFGFIISASIIPFSLCALRLKNRKVPERFVSSFSIAIFIVLVGFSSRHLYYMSQSYSGDNNILSLLYRPQPTHTSKNIFFIEKNINNITISIPKGTNQCFDRIIPCIPYQNNNIEPRGQNIEDGFRIKQQ